MGTLTNDMTRLRGDVDALRNARIALMQNLTRGANGLAKKVSSMRTEFTAAHQAMAKKAKMDLTAYLSGVKKRVNGLRKENTADLAGARLAWASKSNLHQNSSKRSK
jgi:hypothetical protein